MLPCPSDLVAHTCCVDDQDIVVEAQVQAVPRQIHRAGALSAGGTRWIIPSHISSLASRPSRRRSSSIDSGAFTMTIVGIVGSVPPNSNTIMSSPGVGCDGRVQAAPHVQELQDL